MINFFLIIIGKLLSLTSTTLNFGNGSTWPGHFAIYINKNFIKDILINSSVKIILIAGTNGKTTTGKLIHAILAKAQYRVFQNESGANLLNGIASSMLLRSSILCKINYDFAILEVDENTLPIILKEIKHPDFIILLNLFRDQLDRYGEIDTISKKWGVALKKLSKKTKLILNADDPQIASLRLHLEAVKVKFFGLNDKQLATAKMQHAVDSTYCPICGSKLSYSTIYYSHLGAWTCPKCGNTRPTLDISTSSVYPLSGIYNRYNTISAVLVARQNGIKEDRIKSALKNFQPAFGRQEVLNISGKKIHLFLSKNPTSFNQSLRTVLDIKAKNLLIVLNDRIPDGRDVSWIWDVDFEEIPELRTMKTSVSGDRVFDIALRLKYADFLLSETQIHADLKNAINTALKITSKNEALYILSTYSAMLETRKILTGKKIL